MQMPNLSLSVNQLTAETRKAALGKGASYGMADDIARAVEWLAHQGFVPCTELSSYLDAPLEDEPKQPKISDDAITVSGQLGLADVAAGLDYIEAFPRQALCLTDMRYPCLSLALAYLRQAPHFGSFTDDQGCTLQDICMHAPSDITLTLQPFHRPATPIWPARVMIDDITYQQLKNAAFQTYVPSSDSSREAGAGAGLNDND